MESEGSLQCSQEPFKGPYPIYQIHAIPSYLSKMELKQQRNRNVFPLYQKATWININQCNRII
jgi:hypothetical protein